MHSKLFRLKSIKESSIIECEKHSRLLWLGMQGNCTSGPNTATETAAAELKQLFGALTGDPVPLKPFQCLLLTNTNTLALNDGNFWLDNLYFGVTQPRSQYDTSYTKVLATGSTPDSNLRSIFTLPMNIFLTNITVHGHGQEALSTRIVSLTPILSPTSLLFQGPNAFAVLSIILHRPAEWSLVSAAL